MGVIRFRALLVGLSREVRQGAGVQAGDEVDVAIELDGAPRDRRPYRSRSWARFARPGTRGTAAFVPGVLAVRGHAPW